MTRNRDTLECLFAEGKIRLERAPIFDQDPTPLGKAFEWERIEGMLLGLAIGDALGAPTELIKPRLRRRIFGEIRDYLPDPKTGSRRGHPTDDTQLAFWTLEQMLEDDGFRPENVAARFGEDVILGVGASVYEFLQRHVEQGRPWYESGPESAGNGALMRIAPMLVPHIRGGSSELWVDTALSAMITHDDRASTSACVAFVHMLWELLGMSKPPPADWWWRAYVETAAPLEGETGYRPRGGRFRDYEGPLWRFVEERLSTTRRRWISTRKVCDGWWSAAYLLETVPSVLYILARYGKNPRKAIIRAVNDTKDNDTIAAIVGAAVGALHGRSALPRPWVEGLSGRTKLDDDGRVFELLDAARRRWAPTRNAIQSEEP